MRPPHTSTSFMHTNRRLYHVHLEYLFNKIKGLLKNKINEKKMTMIKVFWISFKFVNLAYA